MVAFVMRAKEDKDNNNRYINALKENKIFPAVTISVYKNQAAQNLVVSEAEH